MAIRNFLSLRLAEKGWNQKQLSHECGVHPPVISHLRNDDVDSIKVGYLIKMCDSLGCPLSKLLEYEPNNVDD